MKTLLRLIALFMHPFAILADEMTAVIVRQGLRWDYGVEIEHTSTQVKRFLRFDCPENKAFCSALESLAPTSEFPKSLKNK